MWIPTHQHSDNSLLDGLPKVDQVAERFKECGFTAGALTDHGVVGGIPSFFKAMQARKLRPIAGCEFYLCPEDSRIQTPENRSLSHLVVLAKNLAGWKGLMRATTASYHRENFYYKQRLDLDRLASFGGGNWITFSGHLGSDLADACFPEPKLAYRCRTYDDAAALARSDWPRTREKVDALIRRYQTLFGKENFYLEIQLVDHANLPASLVVAKILRDAARRLGVPKVATADSHYCRREDAPDQRVLLCSALRTTMGQVQAKLDAGEDVGLGAFFRSNSYHVPSLEEMRELHSDCPEELAGSVEIASRCEDYSIGGEPLLPEFPTPDGSHPDDYFRSQCEQGWKKKIFGVIPQQQLPVYEARLWEEEYPILTKAKLSSYFLIVQDYIDHARRVLKSKVGRGRGSAAGCLASYLLDITQLDPIQYKLMFSRFYNAGRQSKDRISLPDIDTDFTARVRDKVISYVRDKYGHDRVCQMATFSRMQGRGALTEVLRVHARCGHEETKSITEHIPDEAAIQDELQAMRNDGEEPSIIRWALEHHADKLRPWCFIRERAESDTTWELDGPLALDFAQAIRLEGKKKNMGRHASGIVICSVPVAEVCPMAYDAKSGELMTAVDYRESEELGLPKFDFLGLRSLSALEDAESLIRTGRLP